MISNEKIASDHLLKNPVVAHVGDSRDLWDGEPQSAANALAMLGFTVEGLRYGCLFSDELRVHVNGLALVTIRAEDNPYFIAREGWDRAPVFTSADGSEYSFLFACGFFDVVDQPVTLDGFDVQVRGWPCYPAGWEGHADFKRTELFPPSNGQWWVRPPNQHKALLQTIPLELLKLLRSS